MFMAFAGLGSTQGFSDPVFQAKRALLQRTLSSDPRKFSMERQKLFLTVQTKAS